ncbi:Kelch repeat protein [Paragonimus heterotremus]|uniref:Kelch repeat protein n=1 Tax=Paragonimus heterotremus TaxID=100268 RepID=A0A8J4WR08_9TREM|nr:Kelch repeat protein [Paragonimus heterotremus]
MSINGKRFTDSAAASNILRIFNEQRMRGEECSFVLSNGTHSHNVHRCLLRAISPIIDKACQLDPTMKEYCMTHLSARALDHFVQYMYTADLILDESIALEIGEQAQRLQIPFISECTRTYIKESLSVENCVMYLLLAKQQNHEELKKVCLQFCVDHYEKLVADEGHLKIPPEEYISILSDNELYVQDEGKLFNSVYAWLNHDRELRAQFAQQLSEHIRYPLLGVRKLLDMLKDETNSYFHEHICKALVDFGQLAEPLARSRWERRPSDLSKLKDHKYTQPQSTSPVPPTAELCTVKKNYILAVVGGRSQSKKLMRDIVCFRVSITSEELNRQCANEKPDESTQRRAQMLPDEKSSTNLSVSTLSSGNLRLLPNVRKGFGAVNVSQQIFLIGGSPASSMHSVDVFDVASDEWFIGPALQVGRCWHGVCKHEKCIFVVGGCDQRNKMLTHCEMLDTRVGQWQPILEMPRPRMSLGACFSNGIMYTVGGVSEASADCFDLRSGRWRPIASLVNVHEALGVLHFGDQLYVLGGAGSMGPMTCVHRYHANENCWEKIRDMPLARAFSATAVIDHYAFVVGGRDETGPCQSIQIYDFNRNSWSILDHTLPSPRSSSCAVVIRLEDTL